MKKSVQAGKYIVSDFIASSVVWLLFNLIRYEKVAVYEGFDTVGVFLLHILSLKGQLLIPFFWFVLYWFSGYYNKPFGKSRLTELFSTLGSVSIGVVILFFALVLNDLPRSYQVYYDMFFSLWGLQFVLTYAPRLLITQAGLRKIKRGEWALNVLMIGAGKRAACIASDLHGLGYNIVGFVSESHLESLPAIVEEKKVDELVVALETADNSRLMDILYTLYCYKRPIKILADKSGSLSRVKIKTIKGVPLVDVTDNNFLPIEQNVKLFMDKTLSLFFLVLLSPLFLYIAWRVKRDSPGPVFFSQERIGYMGEPFMIYKFRTMYTNAEEEGPLLSSEDDRRITPFGRVMRKYRLDELPQFWNVLKGDMSLVGPRPERKYFIERIVRKAPFYYLLHNVRPGITSLGMVKYGYAGSVDEMIERLEYDILYYENMSLILDITILIYTVKTVFTGKGI
ncbi:sugar transferase [Parabacteroides sp. ZJ-118]|uniref:sugar transferase n=1 Tax=Parabacteroides sp. ZJ-118 TaxID=2709398 RepID=UPI0013EAAFAB|nr:sugar transferase [Parabacteroides sp. ZJ-118]